MDVSNHRAAIHDAPRYARPKSHSLFTLCYDHRGVPASIRMRQSPTLASQVASTVPRDGTPGNGGVPVKNASCASDESARSAQVVRDFNEWRDPAQQETGMASLLEQAERASQASAGQRRGLFGETNGNYAARSWDRSQRVRTSRDNSR